MYVHVTHVGHDASNPQFREYFFTFRDPSFRSKLAISINYFGLNYRRSKLAISINYSYTGYINYSFFRRVTPVTISVFLTSKGSDVMRGTGN